MNESTLKQSKILVERIVRPIRTSSTRKFKMREELLTHVLAAFEEELARLDDEQEAFLQTAQRFGNSIELTGQLQASVPKPDWQMRFEQLVGYPEGEFILSRAVRHFVLIALIFLPCIPIFIIRGRMREWPILLWMPILAFSFTLLGHWLREALFLSPKRGWRVAIPVLIISAVASPAITFAMCLTISHNVLTSWSMIAPLIPHTVVLAPIALATCAYASAIDLGKVREWERLSIAE